MIQVGMKNSTLPQGVIHQLTKTYIAPSNAWWKLPYNSTRKCDDDDDGGGCGSGCRYFEMMNFNDLSLSSLTIVSIAAAAAVASEALID